MKREIKNKNYKGLGFVEALIALAVSGIVGIVLMGISADAIRELRKLDMQDAIAQHAVSTSVILQDIAVKQAYQNPEDNIFYELTNNQCYPLDTETGIFNPNDRFPMTGLGGSSRAEYKDSSLVEQGSEYFRVMCVVHGASDSDRRKILVKIVTGSNKVEGSVTSDTDVKDYEYYSIINL